MKKRQGNVLAHSGTEGHLGATSSLGLFCTEDKKTQTPFDLSAVSFLLLKYKKSCEGVFMEI